MVKAVSPSLYLIPGSVSLFLHLDASSGCISLLGVDEKVPDFLSSHMKFSS